MDDADRTQDIRDREERISKRVERYLAGEVTVIGNESPSKLRRYQTK